MTEISNKFLSPAQRLLKFIERQGISKYAFHKTIGVSNGFLDKAKEIRSDNIRKILDKYPMMNPVWLLTGEGNMLLEIKHWKKEAVQTPKVSTDVMLENDTKNITVPHEELMLLRENKKLLYKINEQLENEIYTLEEKISLITKKLEHLNKENKMLKKKLSSSLN